MRFSVTNAKRTDAEGLWRLAVVDGKTESLLPEDGTPCENAFDANGATLFGGITDAHVHLREPGYSHKETVASGTAAAAKGGVTAVLAMPNLNPVPDSAENLAAELSAIERGAAVKVYPYGALTRGQNGKELADIEALAPNVVAFTDDGKGYHDYELLEEAMRRCARLGKIICSHAEAEGYGFSAAAEYLAVERELELVRKTACKYHFCHLSTARSWELVRKAKADGLDVTAEATPHHFSLCSEDIRGTNFKMNPPLREREDMLATLAAVKDGTADMIATDHAPHTAEEKSLSYELAPNGIIGLETMLPVSYSQLVKTGVITVTKLVELLVVAPAKRFNLPFCAFQSGDSADFSLVDFAGERVFTAEEILSKSKNSPFVGQRLSGFSAATFFGGRIVYQEKNQIKR